MPTSKGRTRKPAAKKAAAKQAERSRVSRCHACGRAATTTVQPTRHTERTLHVCAWHARAWNDYEAGDKYVVAQDDDSDRKQIWMGYRNMPYDVDDDDATVMIDGDGEVIEDAPALED